MLHINKTIIIMFTKTNNNGFLFQPWWFNSSNTITRRWSIWWYHCYHLLIVQWVKVKIPEINNNNSNNTQQIKTYMQLTTTTMPTMAMQKWAYHLTDTEPESVLRVFSNCMINIRISESICSVSTKEELQPTIFAP